MIGYTLNVDINMLNQFINNTYEWVSEMNEILRVEGQVCYTFNTPHGHNSSLGELWIDFYKNTPQRREFVDSLIY